MGWPGGGSTGWGRSNDFGSRANFSEHQQCVPALSLGLRVGALPWTGLPLYIIQMRVSNGANLRRSRAIVGQSHQVLDHHETSVSGTSGPACGRVRAPGGRATSFVITSSKPGLSADCA